MQLGLGNNLVKAKGPSNPDGLSLDLQFAADKTLTARKGPTPVFTRASGDNGGTTYFGLSVINAIFTYTDIDYNVDIPQGATVTNGKWEWSNGTTRFYYTGTAWQLSTEGAVVATSAPTSTYFPHLAQWFGPIVTATSSFDIVKAANNEPRFDYDPVTLISKGLLIEEQRTNLLFPSDALTTQTRTVTAVPHTLSFYGTGTIILSGATIATVTGTGDFPTRTKLTFTPSAGSLILTVTGTVELAQLEVGAFATSYIPTVSASRTRSADVCSISDVSTFYNSSEATLFVEALVGSTSSFPSIISLDNASSSNQLALAAFPSPNTVQGYVVSGGTTSASPNRPLTLGTFFKAASSNKLNSFQISMNGVNGTLDTSGAMPVGISKMNIGRSWNGNAINGYLKSVRVYKKAVTDAKLITLTT